MIDYRVVRWEPKKTKKVRGERRFTGTFYLVAQKRRWWGWEWIYSIDESWMDALRLAEQACEKDARLVDGFEVLSEFTRVYNSGIDAPRLAKPGA